MRMPLAAVVRLHLLCLACIGPAALAQSPSKEGSAELAGLVLDDRNAPVGQALVSIAQDAGVRRSATTDRSGRFVFRQLPPGNFSVTAEKTGYPRMTIGSRRPFRPGTSVAVQNGQMVDNLRIILRRGAVITGVVFGHDGLPLPGIPVSAYEVRTTITGSPIFDLPSGATDSWISDDRGVYRIYGLPPGRYIVGTSWRFRGMTADVTVLPKSELEAAFEARRLGSVIRENRGGAATGLNYSATFTPSTTDPYTAADVVVDFNDVRMGVDLKLELSTMGRIEGKISNAPNEGLVRLALIRHSPVRGLNTTAYWPARADRSFTTTSLSPGEYTILAQARSEGATLWALRDVSVSEHSPQLVTLELQPASAIRGKVVFDRDVDAKAYQSVRMVAVPVGTTKAFEAPTPVSVGQDGSFELSGLVPGEYRIDHLSSSSDPWRLASVIASGSDVTDLPVSVKTNSSVGVSVTLTSGLAELSGTIETADGDPGRYTVMVVPADPVYWTPRSRRVVAIRANHLGNYSVRGLPPGEYRVAATDELVATDLDQGSVLSLIQSLGTPIALGVSEKRVLTLKIQK